MKTVTSFFRAFAIVALLTFAINSVNAQVAPTANPSGVCPQQDNSRPLIASGLSNSVWLCNPNSGTANWTQIYPVGGLTPTSQTAFVSNTSAGNTALKVCHATYNFAVDGGAIGLITPAMNCNLPTNAKIYNAAIEYTTAGTSLGSATISIGTTGTGGGAAILEAATAVASATGVQQSLVVPQTASGWKKLTTASSTVTLTVAVAALTAGVCEIYVFYFDSAS